MNSLRKQNSYSHEMNERMNREKINNVVKPSNKVTKQELEATVFSQATLDLKRKQGSIALEEL